MPIAFLSAMREAGVHRIMPKGGRFMENYSEAVTIVFDKTGTLTKVSPKVHDIVAFHGEEPGEMLRLAACLEEHYPHSMANAVVKEAEARGLEHEEKHSRVEYIVAHGIASSMNLHPHAVCSADAIVSSYGDGIFGRRTAYVFRTAVHGGRPCIPGPSISPLSVGDLPPEYLDGSLCRCP